MATAKKSTNQTKTDAPVVEVLDFAEWYANAESLGHLEKVIITAASVWGGKGDKAEEKRQDQGKVTPEAFAADVETHGVKVGQSSLSRHLNVYDVLRGDFTPRGAEAPIPSPCPELAAILPNRELLDQTGANVDGIAHTVPTLIESVKAHFGGSLGATSAKARNGVKKALADANAAILAARKTRVARPDSGGNGEVSVESMTKKSEAYTEALTKTKWTSVEELDAEIERLETALERLREERADMEAQNA